MKKNILFVDDEPEILAGLKVSLRGMQKEWELFFAGSSHEALQYINEYEFEVVVADMRMPDMNGIQLLEVVREKQPKAARIILSGYSDLAAELKAVKPAHQFISKPCKREEMIETIYRILELNESFLPEAASKAVSKIESLPVLPLLYYQVMDELQKAEPSLQKIGKLVEQDPAMSTSILKVVNSAYFGFTRHVRSPAHAVVLLGLEVLKGLILGIHLFHAFQDYDSREYSLQRLWNHSFFTAVFAREIAKLETENQRQIDFCFITGLLHDIGKLPLLTGFKKEYRQVLQKTWQNKAPVSVYEQQVLGTTHAEVGAYLLGLWGFAFEVISGVWAHHHLGRQQTGRFSTGVAVHAANALQHELMVYNHNYAQHPLDSAWMKKHMYLEHIPQWREACKKVVHSEGQN